MPSYLETWDPTVPAGSRDISLGDDDIRSMKRALTERLGEDHEFQTDETGNNKIGYHKKVTLTPRSADPSIVTGCGILFTKDVGSGVIELFYEDAAGNVVQITAMGGLKALSKEVKMWFGSIATLPASWYLCDGTGSRPDLRNRFIAGAYQDSNGVPQTSVTGALSQSASPVHNHGGAVGNTTLTASQIPDLQITTSISLTTGPGGGTSGLYALAAAPETSSTNLAHTTNTGGAAHNHTISNDTAIPPFFALAFISQFNQ